MVIGIAIEIIQEGVCDNIFINIIDRDNLQQMWKNLELFGYKSE